MLAVGASARHVISESLMLEPMGQWAIKRPLIGTCHSRIRSLSLLCLPVHRHDESRDRASLVAPSGGAHRVPVPHQHHIRHLCCAG